MLSAIRIEMHILFPVCAVIITAITASALLRDFEKISTELYYYGSTILQNPNKCFCKPYNRTELGENQSIVHMEVSKYMFGLSTCKRQNNNVMCVYSFQIIFFHIYILLFRHMFL